MDILLTAPPSGPICDFCSETPVTACYHAGTFEMKPVVEVPLRQMSVGDWAACSECEKFIDANDWEGLVARAVTYFFRSHPDVEMMAEIAGMTRKQVRREMKEEFWNMYRQLRQQQFSKSKP